MKKEIPKEKVQTTEKKIETVKKGVTTNTPPKPIPSKPSPSKPKPKS